jgi:3-oxoacyl-[acyl-carrier-protein] synthase III
MSGITISGIGHYAPERRVLNSEIEIRLGLEPGWIVKRTGIAERRYAAEGETLSSMAVKAGDMALTNAKIARKDVALLLLATSTPDHLLPPSAPLVAHKLGLVEAGGIDLAGACAGFIYALTLGEGFARQHQAPVVVIAANVLSRRINAKDKASSVLFADAAGAVVLTPTSDKNAGVRGVRLKSNGARYGLITIPGGGSAQPFSHITDPIETMMVMNDGQAVFSEAVRMMSDCADEALQQARVRSTELDYTIPHQANSRMISAVARHLKLDTHRVGSSIAHYGNSSAATIPLTLSLAQKARALRSGDKILFAAAGAGFTGGAVLFQA